MNPGQQKFFDFIMERVQDGKQNEAAALLNESFAKQADGTFTMDYIGSFAPRLLAILRPEFTEEVKAIMSEFGQRKAK
jgi:hypothetical protein